MVGCFKHDDFCQHTDVHRVVQHGGPFDARTGCLEIMILASLHKLIELYNMAGPSIQRQDASSMMISANLQRFITLCNMADRSMKGRVALK